MSGHESVSAFVFPGGERCEGLRNSEFGGFLPETEAGAELFRHLGQSGLFGQWLAEQLVDATPVQAGDQGVIHEMEKQFGRFDLGFEPGEDLTDGRILLPVALEMTARQRGDEEGGAVSNGMLLNSFSQLVEEGADPVAFWQLVIQARRDFAAIEN